MVGMFRDDVDDAHFQGISRFPNGVNNLTVADAGDVFVIYLSKPK